MVRLALIGLALLLAACNPPDTGTIMFAVSTAPSVLDPRLASDAASERANALLYDRLVRLDEQGAPQPSMAQWQQLDPAHYRIKLMPQRAAFWDGRIPDAADVVATYRSILEPGLGSPHSSALAHVARIAATGDDEVDFHLTRPDPAFASRLTIGIAPAHRLGEGRLAREPLGSGPFTFEEWRADGGLLLKRRADGQQVALIPVADPTMRALKLLRGEAHLLQNDLPSELYGYLADSPGLRLQEHPGTTFAYIGFNLADPVLSDVRVRTAIAHAIDRDAIIRHLFGGRAQTAESVLRPEHWAGMGGLTPYRYDPELARQYLQSAGYGVHEPLVISYKTSTDPFRLRIAHVFQSQLAKVGIRLKISSYDWGTFFGDIKAGRFQMYSLAWVGVNTPDILRYAFHSESIPPGGANRGQYRSSRIDRLIEQAERAAPDAAAELYAEIQRKVHQDLVYVPMWYESNVVASRGLEGYAPTHDGSYLALNAVRMSYAGQ
ncbi:MAG: ABC transporter substrate-binding protein [Gammaproteobacteria bacterium]|nr:ABC transporter substrate-binding protein [Gammaproteobacteria bacterium]